jgi:thiosulfate/3-mercaptopyruvate sulfurtransferase
MSFDDTTVPAVINAAQLNQMLSQPGLRLFDCSAKLIPDPIKTYVHGSGEQDWLKGHIPQAAYIDIQRDLSDAASPLRYTHPGFKALQSAFGQLGVAQDSHVVLYTTHSPQWATRVWWLLKTVGFNRVSILNGGLLGWVGQGLPLEQGRFHYAPQHFEGIPQEQYIATAEDVQHALDQGDLVVNALSREQHQGGGTHYGRPGRISGSLNIPTKSLLADDGAHFLDEGVIAEHFSSCHLPDEGCLVAYCGGGIAASATVFWAEQLGQKTWKLYDNSLSEWAGKTDRPMQTG